MPTRHLGFYDHGLRLTILVLCAFLYGCGDYKVVNTKVYEVITFVELNQLKKDAEIGRSVGRYQTFSRGYRTWRLDTATGSSCLLLSTEEDWKNPETAASACSRN